MEETRHNIKVAIANDHILIRNAIALMVNSFDHCSVIIQAADGKELIDAITNGQAPDIAIVDLNMPVMDGFETSKWLHHNLPQIHVLILTQYDADLALIRLLQTGIKGILHKDVHPSQLKSAIYEVMQSGVYYSNRTTGKIAKLFLANRNGVMKFENLRFSETELLFLKLACSDLTYKEIAGKMGLKMRSIDTMREKLFIKLDIKSRVGLAIFTIKNGMGGF